MCKYKCHPCELSKIVYRNRYIFRRTIFSQMLLTDNTNRQIYFLNEIRYELDNAAELLWHARDRIEDEYSNYIPLRDDEKRAIKPLLDSGYEYIGSGSGRIVLRLPDEGELNKFIVKLSRFGNNPVSIGMWQNNNEVSASFLICQSK